MSVDRMLPNFSQFGFRERAARHRNVAGLIQATGAARGAEGSEEGVSARADQVIEDKVGALVENCRNHLIEFGIADGQISLGDHGAAPRGQRLAEDAVVFPSPDVDGADAERTGSDPRAR
jgi:hypothetical protein